MLWLCLPCCVWWGSEARASSSTGLQSSSSVKPVKSLVQFFLQVRTPSLRSDRLGSWHTREDAGFVQSTTLCVCSMS